MSDRPVAPQNRCPGRASRLALLALVALAPLVGGPESGRAADDPRPEVVRVRVRWDQVGRYLPEGSAVRTLPLDRFEALVAAATRGRSTLPPGAIEAPRRPVRVDHDARWDGHALSGRTVVTLPDSGPSVVCRPWSPALLPGDPPATGSPCVWTNPIGDLIVARGNDPATDRAELLWSQAAVPGSSGRVFALRLPDADVGRLILDLPAGVRPVIEGLDSLGARPGPLPDAPPAPGRVRWELPGASSLIPLALIADDSADRGCWVGGSTRIDLGNATGANWVARWQVHANSPGPTRLTIALPSGLNLLDVTGPDLTESRPVGVSDGPMGGPSQVVVTLRDGAAERSEGTPLLIRGLVHAPLSGLWPVPTAQPLDARWTGGSVAVHLDPRRPLAALETGSGRRLTPDESPTAPGDPPFVFEANGQPGAVATFRFGPASGASLAIRGTLRLGGDRPRLTATVIWTEAPIDPTLDLPPGWTVDRVRRANTGPAPAWFAEVLLGGATRIHLAPVRVAGDEPATPGPIVIEAVRASEAPGPDAERIVLPRVRPSTAASSASIVTAERWEARIEPGWLAEPRGNHGLAWVDPDPLPTERTTTATATAAAIATDEVPRAAPLVPAEPAEQALAWVWLDSPTGPDASVNQPAALVLRRVPAPVQVDEQVDTAIVGDRLRLDWRWSIAASGRPASLPFRVEVPLDRLPRWRIEGVGGPGRVIEPVRLAPEQVAALGWDAGEGGSALALPLDGLPPGALTLRAEAELPWSGSGAIPLVAWPATVIGERAVVVRVENATRFRVDRIEGLIAAPRPSTPASPARTGAEGLTPALRVAGSWAATRSGSGSGPGSGPGSPPARLTVTTQRGTSAGPGAWITEAVLTTRLAPGVAVRHRLILRIATDSARAIPLVMPPGALLERVRRDGQAATVTQVGSTLRINLPATFPTHSPTTITLDYRTPPNPTHAARLQPADLLPQVALPCLSFAWQLKTPADLAARSLAPDLILAEPALASTESGPPGRPTVDSTDPTRPLADLGAILSRSPPLETTLGDWLIRLDSGHRPLLVDRLALQAEGWGPRSRINLADFDPARPGDPRAVFDALGLAIEAIGEVALVTTRSEVRTEARHAAALGSGSNGFATLLGNAAGAGSDPTDRYQTPACWRGEATPRAWLASETPDRDLLAQGWRSSRFVAPGWPGPSVAVALERSPITSRLVALTMLGGLTSLTLILVPVARRVRPNRLIPRLRRLGGRLAPLILVPTLIGWSPPREPVAGPEPILVLIPSDNPNAPDAPSAVALIRPDDHDRLARWAELGWAEDDRISPEVRILAATHRVEPPNAGMVVVRSRVELAVVGDRGSASPIKPTSWTFPIGGGIDLTATVDGQPRPLAIGPDARSATIAGLAAGRSVVEFVRSVACRADVDGLGVRIDEPVVAFPGAQVEVIRDDLGLITVDLPDEVGPRADRPDRISGLLGPRDRFAVVWRSFEPIELDRSDDRVEVAALIRWDAEPAGDLVTLRGTVVGPAPLRVIRLGLEPGLIVRRSAIPGLVGAIRTGTAEHPEWSAFVDPPLMPGARFEVACHRAEAAAPGSSRRLPHLELRDVSVHGLIGLRVPTGWSGRLEPGPGVVAPSGSVAREFARRWGLPFPEGLGPAGLARFDALPTLTAHVFPTPAQVSSRDGIAVAIEPGRLRFALDSVLISQGAAVWDAEATFPESVQVAQVEATGLAAWDQPRPDRVRLVFRTPEPPGGRTIHLAGSAQQERAASPTGSITAPVPRPRWRGAETGPARLTVVGPDSLAVVGPGGGVVLGEAQPNSGETEAPAWEARRWSGTDSVIDQAHLRWEPVPPRVDLGIRSDLHALADRLLWRVEVEVTASGGPVRSVVWRVPTAWSESAQVRSAGALVDARVEVQGESTLWTIPLDPPVWHRRTLTIEASRPWSAGEGIAYPAIEALARSGRGRVVRYDVGWANASGVALDPEATGLVALVGLTGGEATPSSKVGSLDYRVAAERWSLRLNSRNGGSGQSPRERVTQPMTTFDDETRQARPEWVHLDLMVTAATIQGRAEVQVEPGGAFLAVDAPLPATCLGASVDHQLVRPILRGDPAGPQRCVIPLGDGGAQRVVLTWSQDWSGTSGPCALPSFGAGGVRTTVRLSSTDPEGAGSIRGGDWARQTPGMAALTRVDRLAATLTEPAITALISLNRVGDPTETGSVVDRLTALLLAARTAERAASPQGSASTNPQSAARTALDRVRGALSRAGREDLLREAEERVGLVATGPGSSLTDGGTDAPDPFRVRPIGTTRYFQGITSNDPTVSTQVMPATGP